jgi:integrase
VCDFLTEESKNLATIENPPKNGLAGATKASSENISGKIVEYSFWLLKQSYAKSTIEGRAKLMKRFVKLGANLYDPESIKETIAKQSWSEGRKEFAVEAYTNFLIMAGGKWDPPRYRRIEKLPFIPAEQEIDQLIAACGEKTATFLQLMKETGMRAGEAWNLNWTDIDFVNTTVRITPEKRSNPRMFKVSSKLIAMLATMPKKTDRIFGSYDIRGFTRSYQRQRARTALKLGNPRLKQITFHTFRHWKATMEYHKTKDILYVMRLLGHKNIKNTLVYTQLVTFEDDDYVCKAATNVKEATELIETGYEYICEMEHVKLFRKRK